MYTDLMVDLETLGIDDNCIVLSIGAVWFNATDEDTYESIAANKLRCFHMKLDADEQATLGRTVAPSTFFWWLTQSQEAQQALLFRSPTPLRDVLVALDTFAAGADTVWANSPSFDVAKIKSLAACIDQPMPNWPRFYAERDVRTLKAVACDTAAGGLPPTVKGGVAHDALADSINQALLVQQCYAALDGWRKGDGL